jgi:ABC-type glycerol-3-phosphate transport system permease component
MTDSPTMSSMRGSRGAIASANWPLIFTRALIYVILVMIAVVEAFPLMWMIVTSVKDSHEVFNTLLPAEIKWQNFPRVWFAMNFPVHLGNSLYVTGLTVALVVALATPAAYAFARYRFPGRELVFYAFIGVMMIPPQAILIPMFQFLRSLHLLNSLTGLALSYVGGGTAFAVFLMRTFFLSLPGELGDSARIDGCNDFQVFWHI